MENFNLKKFLVENKLTSNSRLLNENQQVVKTLTFGYDLDNVQEVEDYLVANYKVSSNYPDALGKEDDQDPDCYIIYAYGDTVMNGVEIYNPAILQDQEFMDLVGGCDGEGHFEEDDEDTGREEIEKWYFNTHPQADELSQEEEEAGVEAHFEEWNAVKDQYDSIEDYFEDVERNGDWY